MNIARAALAATLLTGVAIIPALPVHGQVLDSLRNRQRRQPAEQTQERARQRVQIEGLEARESDALLPAYQAAQAQNWPAVRTALPAARAGATSPRGRFLLGQIIYQLAGTTQDAAMQAEGITMMVQSGGANPEQLAALQRAQSAQQLNTAVASGNTAAIEAQLEQRLAAAPNDLALIMQVAQLKMRGGKHAEALGLYRRAIQQTQTSGQPVSEDLYRQATAAAYQGHDAEASAELSRGWVQAYPSPASWHDSLAIYAELVSANPALKLDIYRLVRAAGAMQTERDYVELSEAANDVRAFGEVKAVLEEGLARNVFTQNAGYAHDRLTLATQRATGDRPSLATERPAALAAANGTAAMRLGDAYFGYGDYRPAAELYRSALGKSGADAAIVNTRLGAALALAGDRPGAEAAFRAVTGQRAQLAQFWLLWLAQHGR